MSPLEVACPNCQAARLEQCTVPTSTGRRPVARFHPSREVDARAARLDAVEHEQVLASAIEDVRDALPRHGAFDPNLTLSRTVRRLLAALEWNTQAKGDQP